MGPKSETVCEDHVYSGDCGENISVGKFQTFVERHCNFEECRAG